MTKTSTALQEQVAQSVEELSLFGEFTDLCVSIILDLPEEATSFGSEGYGRDYTIIEKMRAVRDGPNCSYEAFYGELNSKLSERHCLTTEEITILAASGFEGVYQIAEQLAEGKLEWRRNRLIDLARCFQRATA